MKPEAGKILISEPFLMDVNFYRTAVFLTEHNESGSLGFVLNQKTQLVLSDLFEEIESDLPIFLGGPVGKDTLHFLHTMSDLPGATEVLPGVFWGGDFDALQFLLRENLTAGHEFRFFAGYSGWGEEQLAQEIELKSWIVVQGHKEYVFGNPDDLWKTVLAKEGGNLSWLSNAPDDVQLN